MEWNDMSEEQKQARINEVSKQFNEEQEKKYPFTDVTQSISFEQFVIERKTGKVKHQFNPFNGEPYQELSGSNKVVFQLLVISYMWLPIIIIPICAYLKHDWLLLFGIIFSFLGIRLSANFIYKQLQAYILGIASLSLTLYLFTQFAVFNIYSFYSVSLFYGFTMFRVADFTQTLFLTQKLLRDKTVFNDLRARDKVTIYRFK